MAQATHFERSAPRRLIGIILLVMSVALAVAAVGLRSYWLPLVRQFLVPAPAADPQEAEHDHSGHDHAGHDDSNSIELSAQARKNIGLTIGEVKLQTFTRTVALPGIVIERPGRSTLEVTTPMTGIITRIYPIQGESVEPNQPLFEMRLTHEEIVQAQADLLRTVEELDVVSREITRLERISVDGAIAGKTLLERKYEQQKLEAIRRSQEQALRLHGLDAEQVNSILQDRALLKQVTIYAPAAEMMDDRETVRFQVQQLHATPGQHVEVGTSLAVLANYQELFIEGSAFERDAPQISLAAKNDWPVTVLLDTPSTERERLKDLRILYLSGKVDQDTRTLHFYVTLPNVIEQESTLEGSRRFFSWRFRPGQRMQLLIPVESLPDRIVLPIDAVAFDGPEAYLFTPNGNHFDRRPVHVEYRDSLWAVVANDGSVFPGDQVALSGAQQLQLAIESKSGGPIDPHAGHNH